MEAQDPLGVKVMLKEVQVKEMLKEVPRKLATSDERLEKERDLPSLGAANPSSDAELDKGQSPPAAPDAANRTSDE